MIDKIIKQTTDENNKLIANLAKMGGALDPLSFVQIQLQAMVELLFNDNLNELELLYQAKLNDVLEQAMKQTRQARIAIDEQQKKLVKPVKPRIIKPGEN